MNKSRILYLTLLFTILSITFSYAQDLVFRPKNPAFGGNYLNYQWMLSSAQVQDKTKDPEASSNSRFSQDPLDRFSESLNRQLLSQLSRQLLNDQFGEIGLSEGSYQIGDFQIEVLPDLDGMTITIYDHANGGETTISIPYF